MENSPITSKIFCSIYELSVEGKITYEEGVKLKCIINKALTMGNDPKITYLIQQYSQTKNVQKLKEDLIEITKNWLKDESLSVRNLNAKKKIVI